MFHGDRDANVGDRGIAADGGPAARPRARTVELVEYKKLDHQLDDSAVRAQMLDKSDAFLRQALEL